MSRAVPTNGVDERQRVDAVSEHRSERQRARSGAAAETTQGQGVDR